jgi:hypothetical protein
MANLKVAILEKDGVEYDTPTEYDLADALVYIGATLGTTSGPSFNEDRILCNEKFQTLYDHKGRVLLGV